MRYSFIIPVYNRPDEVDELLDSLTRQTLRDFEVIVVEDGSAIPCQEVVDKYADRLTIHYYYKENSGPGQTRNYGVERANGEYMLILDSDCILPEGYLQAVEAELQRKKADAFGGPDRAHDSFTDVQKAINYAMTSFLLPVASVVERRNWISSIPVASIWESGRRFTKLWVASRRCVLVRILISVSVSLKVVMLVGCSRRHGYGTSAGRI